MILERSTEEHECKECQSRPVQFVLALLRSGPVFCTQCKDHVMAEHDTLLELTLMQVLSLSPRTGEA